jgi:hypothetical protein
LLLGVASFVERPVGKGFSAFQLNVLIRGGGLIVGVALVLVSSMVSNSPLRSHCSRVLASGSSPAALPSATVSRSTTSLCPWSWLSPICTSSSRSAPYVVTRTYSSVFDASALLVAWENGDLARLLKYRREGSLPQAWEPVSRRRRLPTPD